MTAYQPEEIIDVHSHIFNARYLPLEGIFIETFNVKSAVLARALQNVLFAITEKDALSTDQKRKRRIRLLKQPGTEKKLVKDFFYTLSDNVLAEVRVQAFDNDQRHASRLLEDLQIIRSFYEREHGLESKEEDIDFYLMNLQAASTKGLFTEHFSASFKKPFTWVISYVADIVSKQFGKGVSYVKLIALLLQSESDIIKELFSGYSDEDNVKLYIHLMMDMEKAYSLKPHRGPYYPFESSQLPRMREIVHRSNGKMLGFVAFDPRRPKALDIVKSGLRQGNIGVKFYPPMGYRADPDSPPQKAVFEYCQENDIPVLTHCTPVGFEARKCHGMLADPKHWAKVLAEFPRLRLCFGHAGGGYFKFSCGKGRSGTNYEFYGWLADDAHWDDANYAKTVVDLCRNYKNVFCDFSHLVQVYDGRHPFDKKNPKSPLQVVQDRLIGVLETDTKFADKMMYGSDWHMAKILSGGVDLYLDKFCEIFSHDALRPYGKNFFYENAKNFLNIQGYLNRYQEYGVPVFTDEALAYLKTL
jgi:predicted TIM-barrel fold metal-dependent hydrolase